MASKIIDTVPIKPGAGSVIEYNTGDGVFCILGKRFGRKWKISIGGACDEGETLRETILRENKEELLNHPSCDDYILKETYHMSIKNNYFTVGLISNYFDTEEEVNEFVDIYLNPRVKTANAIRKCLVEKKRFDSQDLCNFLSDKDIFNISEITRNFLEKWVPTKNIPDNIREDISRFTEYSEFQVMKKENVLAIYKAATKKDNPEELFTAEREAVLSCLP